MNTYVVYIGTRPIRLIKRNIILMRRYAGYTTYTVRANYCHVVIYYTTTRVEPCATSIVAPAPTVVGPISNAFLPTGTETDVSILLSSVSNPSSIPILPRTCSAPSDVADPAIVVVLIPTILSV